MNVRLGAIADVPPVVPQVNVLVTDIAGTVNPPEPVVVNPVRVAILSTTVAAVVCVKFILPALALPNAIERVLVLLELNMPVPNVKPSPIVNVPAVRV